MEWRFWARTRPAQFDASGDDCEAIEPLLPLYGDGMASAAEARLVESHLPGCESCRESLAWMQATRRALCGRPVLSPPVDLHARIAEAIAASEAAPLRLRPARTFTTRPAFAAAASLAAVGLFLGYSLTHLPRPGVAVTAPPHSIANVPSVTPPAVITPTKPTAPSMTAKKLKSVPLVADNNTDANDTPSASVTVPTPRVPAKNTVRPVLTAPPVAEATTAPRLKPVAPRPPSLMAGKPAASVKHTPAPLPTKISVLTAKNEGTRTPKEPDVQVLPAKVTPQEPTASVQTASGTPSEPHTQTVDFIREVRVRLADRAQVPSPQAQISRTVGLSLRGAARMTQTFGQDGKAAHIDCIHGNDF